ncbi:MAG: putative esterase [Actinomycetia bacterium]|nr:putative esterase [Actinomycetes bacterium]
MLTRRQLLVGAGAFAVLGAGAAVEESSDPRVRRFLHRLGLEQSPDHHVPAAHAREISGQLTSAHMPHPVGWTIAMPSIPVRGVVYCLHGHGSNHRMPFDDIHVPDVAAAARAPLAVAAVDGGSDSYWHARASGSDPLTMLLDEFIPMVEQHIGSEPPRALLGWSMGGYGALLAAEHAPDRFAAVAAASPALWTTPGATAAIAFDGSADYHRNDVFAGMDRLAAMTVRIDCGTDDPFHDADAEFAARLPHANRGRFSSGFHDDAYWRSVAPAQIATIANALFAR